MVENFCGNHNPPPLGGLILQHWARISYPGEGKNVPTGWQFTPRIINVPNTGSGDPVQGVIGMPGVPMLNMGPQLGQPLANPYAFQPQLSTAFHEIQVPLSVSSGIRSQIPEIEKEDSNMGAKIEGAANRDTKVDTPGQVAQPKARPGSLPIGNEKNMDECSQFTNLGNCGVVRPPPVEGENYKNEPIPQPTRPRKNLEKIHCAPQLGIKIDPTQQWNQGWTRDS